LGVGDFSVSGTTTFLKMPDFGSLEDVRNNTTTVFTERALGK
jgi:hypothetical protein